MKDVKLSIDQYSINIAKGLIMDTVRHANSGHTGGPLSSLDFTYILFKEVLKFDPDNPQWEVSNSQDVHLSSSRALLAKLPGTFRLPDRQPDFDRDGRRRKPPASLSLGRPLVSGFLLLGKSCPGAYARWRDCALP